MASVANAEELDAVTCSVCKDVYKNPVKISCDHTYVYFILISSLIIISVALLSFSYFLVENLFLLEKRHSAGDMSR